MEKNIKLTVKSLQVSLKIKTCSNKIFCFLNLKTILLPLDQSLDLLFVGRILPIDHIQVQVIMNHVKAH